LPGIELETEAEMFASCLGAGHEFASDPFWSDNANGLNAGLIAHLVSQGNPSIRKLKELLYQADLDYQLALKIDEKTEGSPLAHDEFVAFLNHPSDKTRPSVLSTAQTHIKCMATDSVVAAMENSTVSLMKILAGEPITLYIIIAPEKLHSHRALLRLWVGVLLNTVLKRTTRPELPTLFILEEAAQLGTFAPLLTATTLMRAYGLRLVTVWQNMAQIKARYPLDWTTILDNCEMILSFGVGHFGSANELAAYLGMDPAQLLGLRPEEAAVSIRHQGTQVIRKLNYLKDQMFRGMFDPNPMYEKVA
jgi:type IV secretion system protein VirD4